MNNNDYQDMPCISSHWLIDMLQSPAHCYRRHLDPARTMDAPSDALRIGTLVHCLALTPRQFEREFRLIREDRRSRTGRAEWAWTLCQGWTPIRPAELDRARAIGAALKTPCNRPETAGAWQKGTHDHSAAPQRLASPQGPARRASRSPAPHD